MTAERPVSANIHIGCSGWNYRHWRGRFYPEGLTAKRWFAFYADRFDAVEINNSFYRLPAAATFDRWREQAPAGFCYAVKANRFITQAKKLKDCAEPVERMIVPTRHLGQRLGPILYQLPPHLALDLERLETFLRLLPGDLQHVFEFRHASWYVDDTVAMLDSYGAGFVVHDFPGIATPRWVSGTLAYVRFHGATGKYCGRYSDAALGEWADWLDQQRRGGRSAWAFFNNDIDAASIDDALALKAMMDER